MDAVKFIKEKKRMCNSYSQCSECSVGPMSKIDCDAYLNSNVEEVVSIVEKWSSENRVRTRQTEFLKLFPNVKKRKGIIDVCPDVVDEKHHCDNWMNCADCLKNFWDVEVEE